MRTGLGIAVAAGALLVAGFAGTAAADGGAQTRSVTIVDRCDPATFNADPPAGVGPGTCVYAPGSNQRGTTTFREFVTSLNPHRFR